MSWVEGQIGGTFFAQPAETYKAMPSKDIPVEKVWASQWDRMKFKLDYDRGATSAQSRGR